MKQADHRCDFGVLPGQLAVGIHIVDDLGTSEQPVNFGEAFGEAIKLFEDGRFHWGVTGGIGGLVASSPVGIDGTDGTVGCSSVASSALGTSDGDSIRAMRSIL